MPRRRLHRLSSTFLVVLALLFSQLALASYICTVVPGASQATMEMPGGEPCEGMDAEQPNLCFQHCSDAPQNFDPLKAPTAGVPAVAQVLLVHLDLDDALDGAHRARSPAEILAPPDPLFLSTLRLRV